VPIDNNLERKLNSRVPHGFALVFFANPAWQSSIHRQVFFRAQAIVVAAF
jgi:hypothetical protein